MGNYDIVKQIYFFGWNYIFYYKLLLFIIGFIDIYCVLEIFKIGLGLFFKLKKLKNEKYGIYFYL